MRTKVKRRYSILILLVSALLCAAAVAVAISLSAKNAYAASATNIGATFYYDELKNSPLAQKLYGVLSDMAGGGFDDGASEFDLGEVLSQEEIARCADNGDPTIPVAFGAARDAFYMDRPELFFVDMHKLTLTVGKKDNEYYAAVGAGNADNYFEANTFSADTLQQAKINFSAALDDAVSAAKVGSDAVGMIRVANKFLCDNTALDYGAYENKNGVVNYDGNVNTAYGALVEGKALSIGYARAFKAIMDRLGIPCVLISGAVCSGESTTDGKGNTLFGGLEKHMWNAVLVDNIWYGVDVAWNDFFGNAERYLLVGGDLLSVTHIADGVISSGEFVLKYPVLHAQSYGAGEGEKGFEIKDSGSAGGAQFGYIESAGEGGDRYTLCLGVSYKSKNARQLAQEGKYLAVRFGEYGPWISVSALVDYLEAGGQKYTFDKYTVIAVESGIQNIRFAVIDYAPDADYSLLSGETVAGALYNPSNLSSEHFIAVSAPYINKMLDSGLVAPRAVKIAPDEKGYISSLDPIEISIEYDEPLVPVDEGVEVSVAVTGDDDLAANCLAENVEWNEQTNTLSFTFTPSKQFRHNCRQYAFVPTNLVGKHSGLSPLSANVLSYKITQVNYSALNSDSRPYIKKLSDPRLMGVSGADSGDFTGKDGKPIKGDLLSRLMLSTRTPSTAEEYAMYECVSESFGLEDGDILTADGYIIDMQMCGILQDVPKGGSLQIGFALPETSGKSAAYAVYRQTDEGAVIVPSAVTDYGIVASTEKLGAFIVCAVESAKAETAGIPQDKVLYVHATGEGGSVNFAGNSPIRTVEKDSASEYAVTCKAGYTVCRITLNGEDITEYYDGATGKLSVPYAACGKSNCSDVEITFVSTRAAKYYADNGIEVKRNPVIVTSADMIVAVYSGVKPAAAPGSSDTNTTGIVVGVCVSLIAVALAVIVTSIVINKRKDGKKPPESTDGEKTE